MAITVAGGATGGSGSRTTSTGAVSSPTCRSASFARIRAATGLSARAAFLTVRSGTASNAFAARNSPIRQANSATVGPSGFASC